MKNNIKFSVLIPNYNGEKYISRCINSILNQSFTNFEIVIVDGKSEDNSHRIIAEYLNKDKRLRHIKYPVDTCLSDAVNIGIANSEGDYILWLGNDDYLIDPDVLKDTHAFILNNYLNRAKKPVILYGGYKIFWSRQNIYEKRKKRDLDYHFMWFTDSIMCGNVFFERAFCINNNIKLKNNLKYCMDYDLWLQIISKCNRDDVVCMKDRYVHVFTMREDNITGGGVYNSTKEALQVALSHNKNPFKTVGIYIFIGIQLVFQRSRDLYLKSITTN